MGCCSRGSPTQTWETPRADRCERAVQQGGQGPRRNKRLRLLRHQALRPQGAVEVGRVVRQEVALEGRGPKARRSRAWAIRPAAPLPCRPTGEGPRRAENGPGHQSKPKPAWFYCKLAIPILAMLGQDLAKGGMGFRL